MFNTVSNNNAVSSAEAGSASSVPVKKFASFKRRAVKAVEFGADVCKSVGNCNKFNNVAKGITNIAKHYVSPATSVGGALGAFSSFFGIFSKIAKPFNLFLSIKELADDSKKMMNDKHTRIADKIAGLVSSIFWAFDALLGVVTMGVELISSAVSAIPILGAIGNCVGVIAAGTGSVANCLKLYRLGKEGGGEQQKLLRRQLWQQLFTEQKKEGAQRDTAKLVSTWEALNKKFPHSRGAEKWKNRLDPALFDQVIEDKKSRLSQKKMRADTVLTSLTEWKLVYDPKKKVVNKDSLDGLKKFYANKRGKFESKRLQVQTAAEQRFFDKKISGLQKKIELLDSGEQNELMKLCKSKLQFIGNREEKWKKEQQVGVVYNSYLQGVVDGPDGVNRVSRLLDHRVDEAKTKVENNLRDRKRTWVTLATNIVIITISLLALIGFAVSVASGGALAVPFILVASIGLLTSCMILGKYLLHNYAWKEKKAASLEAFRLEPNAG